MTYFLFIRSSSEINYEYRERRCTEQLSVFILSNIVSLLFNTYISCSVIILVYNVYIHILFYVLSVARRLTHTPNCSYILAPIVHETCAILNISEGTIFLFVGNGDITYIYIVESHMFDCKLLQ